MNNKTFPQSQDDLASTYRMTISLSVLDDLGIRLYSKVPAVLSEVVANAWDADADEVTIEIYPEDDRIVIYDNGHGMTKSDINQKYLTVGYRKRESEPPLTAKFKRHPMGRKGIGKLSVFSIAKTVEVYSVKNGEYNALRMNSDDIKAEIKAKGSASYTPIDLGSNVVDINQGTKIILTNLKRNVTNATAEHLRTRLARRFSIIGPHNNFAVKVNGSEISARDRDYYHMIQFMWRLGDNSEEFESRCKNLDNCFVYNNEIEVDGNIFQVNGWIGTVFESGKLDDDTNTIVVFANGKLIHEDVLNDLNETGVYASFLIGEIDADFMDHNEDEDIVTSARQSVQQDAERYVKLREFIFHLLKNIQSNWTELRTQVGAERILQETAIKRWYERLSGDHQKFAHRMLGKIESLGLPDSTSKREMVKANMLAFERLAMDHQLSLLENIETQEQFEILQNVLGNVSELERVHYHQIAKGRVDIIKAFERLVDEDQKEKVIQKFLFRYLWLLDPS